MIEYEELKPNIEGESGWYGNFFLFKEGNVLSLFESINNLLEWKKQLLKKHPHLKLDEENEVLILRETCLSDSLMGITTNVNEGYGTIALKFLLVERD